MIYDAIVLLIVLLALGEVIRATASFIAELVQGWWLDRTWQKALDERERIERERGPA